MCFRISSSASSSETDAKDSVLPFSPNRNIYTRPGEKKSHLQIGQFSKRAENRSGTKKKNQQTNVDENCAISNSTVRGLQCSQNFVLYQTPGYRYATSGDKAEIVYLGSGTKVPK